MEDKCCDLDLKGKSHATDKDDCYVFPNDLLKTIEEIAKKEGYIKFHADKKAITTEGGNYLGVLYEVDLKGKTGDAEKQTNLFIKYTINTDHQTIFSVPQAYRNESFAYKELSKIFTDFQDEAKIREGDKFKMPKCFEANTKVIILENLSKKGFKTYHRMDVMSVDFAKLCIQQLAKFHGLFYVLEARKPEYFQKNCKVIKQPFDYDKEDFVLFVKNMCEVTCRSLDEDSKKKIEKFVPKIFELFPKYMDYSTKGSTICHGDFRVNNILVKERNEKAVEVIPVDYQTLYCGCPVNDLIYFIYTGTDYEFRKKNLENLKDLYYESLKNFLDHFSLDVNKIFPREEFEKQFKGRRDFGLIVTLYSTPFLFTVNEHVPDAGKENISKASFVLDPRSHERVQSTIDEFVELGYL